MFMTQAQIASQIWGIGPLLTHSLMVTAELCPSLCLLCLQFFPQNFWWSEEMRELTDVRASSGSRSPHIYSLWGERERSGLTFLYTLGPCNPPPIPLPPTLYCLLMEAVVIVRPWQKADYCCVYLCTGTTGQFSIKLQPCVGRWSLPSPACPCTRHTHTHRSHTQGRIWDHHYKTTKT